MLRANYSNSRLALLEFRRRIEAGDAATIDLLFSEGPDHYTPGSKMPMQRITGPGDPLDLIEYLSANTGPPAKGEAKR